MINKFILIPTMMITLYKVCASEILYLGLPTLKPFKPNHLKTKEI